MAVWHAVRMRAARLTAGLVLAAAVASTALQAGAESIGPVDVAVRPAREHPATRSFTIAVSGDVLPHTPVVEAARAYGGGVVHDFRPMFRRLRPLVAGVDVGICHLETPVAPPGEPLTSFPQYGVPSQIADGIASAGYDRCSTASNHTLDRGVAGVDATVAALRRAGLGQSGMARRPEEAVPRILRSNGIRYAHLSYTYSFNGARLPVAEPWRSALIDPVRIVGDAADARRRGAEVVLVSLHWGIEGVAAPSAEQRAIAEAVTSSGLVDLVIGHHAHVLQPIERVNGVWTIFGLGNQLSNMPTGRFPPSSQDGAVVTVEIRRGRDGMIRVRRPVVHPTWVDRERGFVIRPVLDDLADPTVPEGAKPGMRLSLERTRSVLGPFLATD